MRTLATVFIAIFPVLAHAELTQCNGVWTNQPCDGAHRTSTRSLVEQQPPPNVGEILERRKKLSATHELIMKRTEAEKELGVPFEVNDVERTCAASTTTLAQCNTLVAERLHEIEQKLFDARQERAKQSRATPTPVAAESVVITINQSNHLGRGHHYRERDQRDGRDYTTDERTPTEDGAEHSPSPAPGPHSSSAPRPPAPTMGGIRR